MFKSSVVRQAMQESAQVQARAQLGAALNGERPLFADGLISSPDGLLWLRCG
jgi:halogenation protein CepH